MVAASSVEAFRPLARRRSVTIATRLTSQRVTVLCCTDAMRQVVLNLLDNALKYGPERQQVTVTVESSPPRVVVEDEGPGIPSPTGSESGNGSSGWNAIRQDTMADPESASRWCATWSSSRGGGSGSKTEAAGAPASSSSSPLRSGRRRRRPRPWQPTLHEENPGRRRQSRPCVRTSEQPGDRGILGRSWPMTE